MLELTLDADLLIALHKVEKILEEARKVTMRNVEKLSCLINMPYGCEGLWC